MNDALEPSAAPGRVEHASALVVMISGGFKSTYGALLPDFERATGACVLTTKLFKRLGTEGKAKGEAAVGFQEVAELLPVPGITFVGRIPAEDEFLTRFTAAVASRTKNGALARRLMDHLASPSAYPVPERMGLEPPKT